MVSDTRNPKEFGKLLRKLRRSTIDPDHGGSLTQQRCAELLGKHLMSKNNAVKMLSNPETEKDKITFQTWNNWEHGKSLPKDTWSTTLDIIRLFYELGGPIDSKLANHMLNLLNFRELNESEEAEIFARAPAGAKNKIISQGFLRPNPAPTERRSHQNVELHRELTTNLKSTDGFPDLASPDAKKLMQLADIDSLAIDDCILIAGSDEFMGWSTAELNVTLRKDKVRLPSELENIVKQHKDRIMQAKGNTVSYRVTSLVPWLIDKPIVQVQLSPIDFEEYYTIYTLLDEPVLKNSDGRPITIREKYGTTALTYDASTHPAIPSNVSIHIIVVSQDNQLLLTKRSNHVFYYPNAWSVSLEETMNEKDNDFIEATLRGLKEELGASTRVMPNDITVLSFCVEYPTLSFDVICLAKIQNTIEEIRNSWLLTAPDRHELQRADSRPLQIGTLTNLLFQDRLWHPSSRMRLVQFLFHTYRADQTLSALKRPSQT